MRSSRHMRLRLLLPIVSVLLAVASGQVLAASASRDLQSISPADKKRIRSGAQPTFKVRISKGEGKVGGLAGHQYAVFIRVSKSAKKHRLRGSKKNDEKVIASDALIATMKQVRYPRGRTFKYTPRRYKHPGYWLNDKSGTYYWQAYYIYCVKGTCVHPSRVKTLRIRG